MSQAKRDDVIAVPSRNPCTGSALKIGGGRSGWKIFENQLLIVGKSEHFAIVISESLKIYIVERKAS